MLGDEDSALHPGRFLWDKFMKPDGLTLAELADTLGVPDTHIQAIIDHRCSISDIIAIRMAKHFNKSHLFWLLLQSACNHAA